MGINYQPYLIDDYKFNVPMRPGFINDQDCRYIHNGRSTSMG